MTDTVTQRKCPACKAPLLPHEATCPNCNASVKPAKRSGTRCRCRECGAKFRTESMPGTQVDCPKCGDPVKVPYPESFAMAASLASKESRPRKKLGPGWDVTWDGLDRLYFYGTIAGFTLLAWFTCVVVLAIVIFIPFVTGLFWTPYIFLVGLAAMIVRQALESDQDMRIWGAYIVLGILVSIPVLGLFVTLAVIPLGFFVLGIALIMSGVRLLKCLAIPAESHARPFIIGSVLLLLVGLGFFAAAAVQAALNITSMLDPAGVPYLEQLLLSGVLFIILANCLFALFLRLIPAFMEDAATSEAVTNYVMYVFGFAIAALVLTGLLHSGALVGEGIGMQQMGPNIARIIFLTLVGINVYLLLRSISASRDIIGHHLR